MVGGGDWWRPGGGWWRLVVTGGGWWSLVVTGGGWWSLLLGADDVISGDFWVWDFPPILSPPPTFDTDKEFAALIIRTRAIFGYVYLLLGPHNYNSHRSSFELDSTLLSSSHRRPRLLCNNVWIFCMCKSSFPFM